MPGVGIGIRIGGRGAGGGYSSELLGQRLGYDLLSDGVLTGKIFPTIAREDGAIGAYVAAKWRLNPSQNKLDIGATDFTMFGWIHGSLIGNSVTYLGKLAAGLPPNPTTEGGKYGLRSLVSSGTRRIACYIVSDSNYYPIVSDIVFDTKGWFHFLMEVDQTNHKFRFFVDGTQIGADVDIAGDFPAVASTPYFEFGYGSWRCKGYNIGIAHRLLSVQEKLDSLNKKTITNTAAFYPHIRNTSYSYDVSGNGNHLLSPSSATYTQSIFYIDENHGSLHCLDYGYSVWKDADEKEYIVPNLDTGLIIDLSATLTLIKSVTGSANTHNLADSVIEFNTDIFDKSSETKIKQSVRDFIQFYDNTDANTKKRWGIDELNRDFLDFKYQSGYNKIVYPRIANNSYNDRLNNLRILEYNKNVSDLKHIEILTTVGDSGLNTGKSRSGVCITFDDTARSTYWVEYFKYLYDKYQFHSSIAINTGSTVGGTRTNRNNIFQCLRYGSEIMNHSVNHIDWIDYLTTHTYEELYDTEVVPAQTEINDYLFYNPSVLASWQVYGFDAGWATYLLAHGFDFVRFVADELPADYSIACYNGTNQYVQAIMHTVAIFPNNPAGDDLLLGLVDYAKANNTIIHIIFHTISTVNSDGSLSVSITRLEKFIKYVYDNDMTFYLTSEMKPSLFA